MQLHLNYFLQFFCPFFVRAVNLKKIKEAKDKAMNKKYANIKDVSEYTSLPTKTLYDWASTVKIPSIKIGRRVLFDLNDIDNLMTSLKRNCNQNEKTANKIIEEIFD